MSPGLWGIVGITRAAHLCGRLLNCLEAASAQTLSRLSLPALTDRAPSTTCRLALSLADFELIRKLGDGSFAQVGAQWCSGGCLLLWVCLSCGWLPANHQSPSLLPAHHPRAPVQVVEVRHKATGRVYALKVVDKHLVLRHKQANNIRTERALLDRLAHPGIVRLRFTFQDAASLYLGLDLCPNGAHRPVYMSLVMQCGKASLFGHKCPARAYMSAEQPLCLQASCMTKSSERSGSRLRRRASTHRR